MINPKLQTGDRIVLLTMEGEIELAFNDRGVVEKISDVFGNKQYKIKWDNGSSLDLLEDADKWMKEEDYEARQKKKKLREAYTITKKDFKAKLGL